MAIFAVSGCAYFKTFGVSDSLGESIGVLSVGNVKLVFKNCELRIAFDPLHCTKTAKLGIESTETKTISWYATKFNDYLRERQLSRFVF